MSFLYRHMAISIAVNSGFLLGHVNEMLFPINNVIRKWTTLWDDRSGERGAWSDGARRYLYMFFWVFPRRQIVFFRRFETLCQVHPQRLDVKYEVASDCVLPTFRNPLSGPSSKARCELWSMGGGGERDHCKSTQRCQKHFFSLKIQKDPTWRWPRAETCSCVFLFNI
jgi:hypothetical protein